MRDGSEPTQLAYIEGSAGSSGTRSSGIWSRTQARSCGLSSIRSMWSSPMFSSRASDRMLVALSSQLIRYAARWASRISMLGWLRSTASASASLFLLHSASRMPCRWRSSSSRWKSTNSLPGHWGPSAIPPGPSSPSTPPQSVLSRSSTMHLVALPIAARAKPT